MVGHMQEETWLTENDQMKACLLIFVGLQVTYSTFGCVIELFESP